MKSPYLEAGRIVNTHGIRGELKIQPWCDTPEFLCRFRTLYIDGAPVRVTSARVHKGSVLVTLEGVSDIDAALAYKNKVVHIARADAGSVGRASGDHLHDHGMRVAPTLLVADLVQ